MGQYYKPVNLDSMEWIYTHDIKSKYKGRNGNVFYAGEGLKLMEHSYIGNKVMNAVERLLIPGGDWHKSRLVWAGDYADHEEGYPKRESGNDNNIHTITDDEGTKIKPKIRKVNKKYKYLANHTKKVYIDLSNIAEDDYGYKIHPLSILVCEGNGRGGGDFRGDDSRVGMWARDIISLEESIAPDFCQVDGQFFEDRQHSMGDESSKSLPDMVISA